MKNVLQRKVARKNQQDVNESRRQKHLPVALALRDPLRVKEVIASAKQYVDMWRAKGLCSRDYIDAWDNLLNHPDRAADILEAKSSDAAQLRQNSPFVSIVRRFESAHAA